MSEIARALEKNHGSIHYAVSLHGGIAPVERRRSRLALSLPEREEISRGIAAARRGESHGQGSVRREGRQHRNRREPLW